MNDLDWEALARKGALEAFMEGDEERALDLLAAARAIAGNDERREPPRSDS